VILTVGGTIVLSQHETDQHQYGTDDDEINDQMTLIEDNHRQLMNKVNGQHDYIRELEADGEELLALFHCHFPPCRWCTCSLCA